MLTKYRLALLSLLALGLTGWIGRAALAQEKDASVERMRKDIFFLASEECEGRGVGTLGLDLAAQYVAVQFKMAGLKPGGVNGTYFQPFPFATGGELDGESTLILKGPGGRRIELKQGEDFQVVGSSAPGMRTAPLVFVGYGVSANGVAYDDYAGVDVKGKIVVALRKLPRWSDKDHPFAGANKDKLASLTQKQNTAEGLGAVALILVNDASEMPKDGLVSYEVTKGISTVSTPFVNMKRAELDGILRYCTGKDLADTEKAIDADLKPQSAALKGWTAHLDVKVKRKEIPVKNVVGYVEGSGPLADETVVVGAHYDHLGYGGGFGSLGGKAAAGKIHYGADDNGSGTTTMMELARRFAANKNREGRRMVFMAFTAEEMGLIGSRHYTQVAPLFPLKNTTAMFNLDMVGRLSPRIISFDDGIITLADEAGKETGKYSLADGCKLYRQAKGVKVEIKDGKPADLFKDIPAKGLSAAVTRNAKNQLTAIIVSGEPTLLVEGFNTAKEFDGLVTKMNPGFDIVKKNSRGFTSSDQYNFYTQKIPVVFFWTGEHPDYHRPSDTADKINIAGMKKIADYAELVINDLRTNPKRPEYTAVKGAGGGGGGGPPTSGPSLRFRPDPEFAGKGVLIDTVVEGGPLAKAGVKDGDIIVELAGKAVTSVTDYNVIRATLKAGVEIEIKIVRDKKELTFKVTPVTLK
jgi:Peptidase family M28/PDZ domain/PA domain